MNVNETESVANETILSPGNASWTGGRSPQIYTMCQGVTLKNEIFPWLTEPYKSVTTS